MSSFAQIVAQLRPSPLSALALHLEQGGCALRLLGGSSACNILLPYRPLQYPISDDFVPDPSETCNYMLRQDCLLQTMLTINLPALLFKITPRSTFYTWPDTQIIHLGEAGVRKYKNKHNNFVVKMGSTKICIPDFMPQCVLPCGLIAGTRQSSPYVALCDIQAESLYITNVLAAPNTLWDDCGRATPLTPELHLGPYWCGLALVRTGTQP